MDHLVDQKQLLGGGDTSRLLWKIANKLLDELEKRTDMGTLSSPSNESDVLVEPKKNESNNESNNLDLPDANDAILNVINWKQITERWIETGWSNPLELTTTTSRNDDDADDSFYNDFQILEQVHAFATTVQLQRLRQGQQQGNPPTKPSLEQELLQVQDSSHLSQLLGDQPSLSPQQKYLIQSAWTFFESDYDRRKQAMQQRVRILEESFHKGEKEESHTTSGSDDGEGDDDIGTGVDAAEESNQLTQTTTNPQSKTLEMVLKEFQKPRAIPSRTSSREASADSRTKPSVVDDIVVEDRGGRLHDDNGANSGMPTWQAADPSPVSPNTDRTGRGRSRGRGRGRAGNKRKQ